MSRSIVSSSTVGKPPNKDLIATRLRIIIQVSRTRAKKLTTLLKPLETQNPKSI